MALHRRRREDPRYNYNLKPHFYNKTTEKEWQKRTAEFRSLQTQDDYRNFLKKISKKADERMRSLEGAEYYEKFKGIKNFAYRRALKDIERFGGGKRFDTKQPKTMRGVKAKINAIMAFLNSVSSTRTGVLDVYKRRVDTLNKSQGTNFTWQELAAFWESKAYEILKESFTNSETLVQAVDILVHDKKRKEYEKRIEEGMKQNKGFFDIVDDVANQINDKLKENGLTYDDLI